MPNGRFLRSLGLDPTQSGHRSQVLARDSFVARSRRLGSSVGRQYWVRCPHAPHPGSGRRAIPARTDLEFSLPSQSRQCECGPAKRRCDPGAEICNEYEYMNATGACLPVAVHTAQEEGPCHSRSGERPQANFQLLAGYDRIVPRALPRQVRQPTGSDSTGILSQAVCGGGHHPVASRSGLQLTC